MQLIKTVGVAVIRHSRLLVVRKSGTAKYLLPGGKIAAGESEIACAAREVFEELSTYVLKLDFIGEFVDIAANEPEALVSIRLYRGELEGEPIPSGEIEEIRWFDLGSQRTEMLAEVIKNQILGLLPAFL